METKNKILNKLLNLLFYLCILIFTIGLNFQDTPPPNGWYQQWMPDLSGASIRDITFTDSSNGYAVTNIGGSNSYILKTTNGGDNWTVKFTHNQPFVRVMFISSDIGFTNAFTKIFKTTNGGENWNAINLPLIFGDDMFVLNEDTIWLAMSESLTGGVFRTTNGGVSWQQQLALGSQNPTHIYFYNGDIGFIAEDNDYLRKTTNSGVTWSLINGIDGFRDIYFADSLTGWKASTFGMKKTTNGGLNWVTQTMPTGGIIAVSFIYMFSNINRDTLWGTGGYVLYPNNQIRGLLYRTTNGGENWFYQIPDTSIHIGSYGFIDFFDKKHGWAYKLSPTGIHTKSSGDTTWYSGIQQINTEIPKDYKLYQNYPNPFNPRTIIPFSLKRVAYVRLIVYDATGKEIQRMVEGRYGAGEYEVDFMGKYSSSGIYFYVLEVDGNLIGTKKMLLIK